MLLGMLGITWMKILVIFAHFRVRFGHFRSFLVFSNSWNDHEVEVEVEVDVNPIDWPTDGRENQPAATIMDR